MVKLRLSGTDALNVVGVLIIIYLVVTLGETVKKNYDLNQQISSLQSQISLLNSQKEELAYDIQYYGTDTFKQREARSKLGLQAPGESVLVLPSPHVSSTPATTTTKASTNKSNWRQWLDFLTGHA